jgi:glucose dehydrogenase
VHLHDTDVTSLVFGLVFLGITLVWALVEVGVLTLSLLPVVVPAVLVVVGALGVAAAVRRARRDAAEETF